MLKSELGTHQVVLTIITGMMDNLFKVVNKDVLIMGPVMIKLQVNMLGKRAEKQHIQNKPQTGTLHPAQRMGELSNGLT